MKKILALVLTLMLAAGMVSALAAVNDNVTINVSGITAGDKLQLFKIADVTYNSTTNQLDYTWYGGLTAADFTFNDEGNTFTQNSAGQLKAMAVMTALRSTTPTEAFANASGVATASVAPGYYLGFVVGNKDSGKIYQRMIINAIPVVDAEHNTYVAHETININVKSTPITITKTEPDPTLALTAAQTTDGYHLGETIPFTITTRMPSYPNTSINATAVITDTPTGLDDDETSVIVTVGGSPYTKTATATEDTDTFTVEPVEKGFRITFAKAFILAHPADEIVVTYNAVLEGPVTLAGGTTNTASIEYNPNPHETTTVKPDSTDTQKIYGLVVYKYEDKGTSDKSTALPGASFKLVAANDAGTAPADPEVVLKTGTTNANGYISWSGLKNGTYYLIETAAPAGYRLDSTPRQVVLNGDTATGDDPTTADTETYFAQKDIPNEKGSSLPETGGIGTTIFYVLGSLLAVGAVILLVTKKRMNAED